MYSAEHPNQVLQYPQSDQIVTWIEKVKRRHTTTNHIYSPAIEIFGDTVMSSGYLENWKGSAHYEKDWDVRLCGAVVEIHATYHDHAHLRVILCIFSLKDVFSSITGMTMVMLQAMVQPMVPKSNRITWKTIVTFHQWQISKDILFHVYCQYWWSRSATDHHRMLNA